jgi:hypothetical protein
MYTSFEGEMFKHVGHMPILRRKAIFGAGLFLEKKVYFWKDLILEHAQ